MMETECNCGGGGPSTVVHSLRGCYDMGPGFEKPVPEVVWQFGTVGGQTVRRRVELTPVSAWEFVKEESNGEE